MRRFSSSQPGYYRYRSRNHFTDRENRYTDNTHHHHHNINNNNNKNSNHSVKNHPSHLHNPPDNFPPPQYPPSLVHSHNDQPLPPGGTEPPVSISGWTRIDVSDDTEVDEVLLQQLEEKTTHILQKFQQSSKIHEIEMDLLKKMESQKHCPVFHDLKSLVYNNVKSCMNLAMKELRMGTIDDLLDGRSTASNDDFTMHRRTLYEKVNRYVYNSNAIREQCNKVLSNIITQEYKLEAMLPIIDEFVKPFYPDEKPESATVDMDIDPQVSLTPPAPVFKQRPSLTPPLEDSSESDFQHYFNTPISLQKLSPKKESQPLDTNSDATLSPDGTAQIQKPNKPKKVKKKAKKRKKKSKKSKKHHHKSKHKSESLDLESRLEKYFGKATSSDNGSSMSESVGKPLKSSPRSVKASIVMGGDRDSDSDDIMNLTNVSKNKAVIMGITEQSSQEEGEVVFDSADFDSADSIHSKQSQSDISDVSTDVVEHKRSKRKTSPKIKREKHRKKLRIRPDEINAARMSRKIIYNDSSYYASRRRRGSESDSSDSDSSIRNRRSHIKIVAQNGYTSTCRVHKRTENGFRIRETSFVHRVASSKSLSSNSSMHSPPWNAGSGSESMQEPKVISDISAPESDNPVDPESANSTPVKLSDNLKFFHTTRNPSEHLVTLAKLLDTPLQKFILELDNSDSGSDDYDKESEIINQKIQDNLESELLHVKLLTYKNFKEYLNKQNEKEGSSKPTNARVNEAANKSMRISMNQAKIQSLKSFLPGKGNGLLPTPPDYMLLPEIINPVYDPQSYIVENSEVPETEQDYSSLLQSAISDKNVPTIVSTELSPNVTSHEWNDEVSPHNSTRSRVITEQSLDKNQQPVSPSESESRSLDASGGSICIDGNQSDKEDGELSEDGEID